MQITYKDKVTLQSNSNIPDENKVTAEDMNEIKSVVNSNEEEQQALNMSVQEIAQNVVNNSQEISNIKEEQTTQNDNIQTNSNNISDLQSNKADKNEIPTDLSQLSNENTKFVNETGLENAISQEKTQRQNADNNLQNQIDAITASTDVIDIVGTYQDLQDYDTSKVKQNDVIKVLQDSTHNNAMSYYRWQNQWIYIGSEGPYYTIGQTDELLQGKANQSDLNQTNTNVTNLAERVSNNESKIENIEQEQTEQNTNISTNATNIESLQEENENLKKIVSQLPQVTGQGTEVTLENTIEAPFTKFDVEGNSVQNGSTSPDNEVPIYSAGDNENLFDIETSTAYQLCTKSDDVFTTSAMTRFAVPKIKLGVPLTVINGTDYYISYDVKTNSGDAKKLNYYGRLSEDAGLNITTNFGELIGTFTMSNSYQRVLWKTTATSDFTANYLFLQATSEITNAQTISIKNIKISEVNTKPYSPYGMGSINEKIQNKNWFNKNSNFKTYGATVTPIDTGIKVENNDGGTYRSVWCEIGKDELLGKTLTIQTSISTYNGAISRILVVFNNETAQYIEQIKTITTSTEGTLVNIPNSFPENADRVSLIFYCSFTSATPEGSYVEYKDLQVELGSTATPYVEHKEQDYSIFVQQPFRSNKDKKIRDEFVVKSDGKLYERHYIARKIFDGTGYWMFSADQGGHSRFDFRIADAVLGSITNNPIQSNRFRTNFAVEDNSIFLSGVEPMISIICDEFRTLDGFKTMLAEKYANGNPVYADYLRKTPLDLPCTEEQIQQIENKPSTYKDFTIIQSQDETPAYLEVSGIYDMNKLITRVEVIESEV